MQRDCFLSSLTYSFCKRVYLCVCVCTGEGRADTSLSVVLMVPLTTQQLLHIGVVLAVGFKHKDSHTRAFAHAHTLIIGCQDEKSRSVSAPFSSPLNSLFFTLFLWWQNLRMVQADQHTTHTLLFTQMSSMCVSPCVMSVLHHLLAYWIVNVWPLLRRGHTYPDLPSPLDLSFSFLLPPFYPCLHKTLHYLCVCVWTWLERGI